MNVVLPQTFKVYESQRPSSPTKTGCCGNLLQKIYAIFDAIGNFFYSLSHKCWPLKNWVFCKKEKTNSDSTSQVSQPILQPQQNQIAAKPSQLAQKTSPLELQEKQKVEKTSTPLSPTEQIEEISPPHNLKEEISSSPALNSPTISTKMEAEVETFFIDFWLAYLNPKLELWSLLKECVVNRNNKKAQNNKKAAEFLYQHYISYLKNNCQTKTDVIEKYEMKFIATLILNLEEKFIPTYVENQPHMYEVYFHQYKEKKIGNRVIEKLVKRKLNVFETLGDGSCGVHALLGEMKVGIYRVPNPGEVRKEFCNFLRAQKLKNQLPERIKAYLDDIFLNFDDLKPLPWHSTIAKDRANLYKNYLAKNCKEQDEIKNVFIDRIFEKYLKKLKRVEEYLDQQELVVLADWKGLRIRITSSLGPVVGSFAYNEHLKTVEVYYSKKHFERAELTKL